MIYLLESYRYVFALVLALIVFGAVLLVFNRIARTTEPVSGFSLSETITSIKAELQKLENAPGERLGLVLSEVKIDLAVQEDRSSSGEVSLTVPVFDETELKNADGRISKVGSTVSVVLLSPDGSAVLSGGKDGAIRFADLLIATRDTLRMAMQNEPKLDAKSIEVRLSFVLVTSKTMGAAVSAKIVSIAATAKSEATGSNTVSLRYVNPAYQEKTKAGVPLPP